MDGFVPGSRATLMMDIVATAMFFVIPLVASSIYLAKKGHYRLHKKLQTTIGITLLVVVALFEIEVRTTGWRQFATPSPFYGFPLFGILTIHVCFSISAFVLWIVAILHAYKIFPKNPAPNTASGNHRKLGKATFIATVLTSCTGWTFYYMAFLAV